MQKPTLAGFAASKTLYEASNGSSTSRGAYADEKPIQLSDSERAVIHRNAVRGLVRVLLAQALMAVFAGLVSWVVAGVAAGASALLGAGAYFVPNALFAMRLLLGYSGLKPVAAQGFLAGELIKLASATLLLLAVALLAKAWLVWPALLFGLVCVLKGYVLLLMFQRLP